MRYLLHLALATALCACGDNNAPTASLQLDTLRGQWVVINYWAKWCKPCIREIPELNTLNRQYPQVTVFGVNYDGVTGSELDQQLHDLGIAFPTLTADPAGQLGVPRPLVLPTTLILDPQGQLSETLVGPQTLESLGRATGQIPATAAGRGGHKPAGGGPS